MSRFYQHSNSQDVDYMYQMPEQLMYQVLTQADQKVNETLALHDTLSNTIAQTELNVLDEFRDDAESILKPYEEEMNNQARILTEEYDPKRFLRERGKYRSMGTRLGNELTRGKVGSHLRNSAAYNASVQAIMADKNIDPELRDRLLASRYNGGYLAKQIANSKETGNSIVVPNVPEYFDVNAEVMKLMKEFNLDETETFQVLNDPTTGTINTITSKNKNIDPQRFEQAIQSILSNPKYQAGNNFSNTYLGTHREVGRDAQGNPLYQSSQRYLETTLNEAASKQGFGSYQEHIQSAQQPYQDEYVKLAELVKNGKLSETEFNKQTEVLRKEAETQLDPINQYYSNIRTKAMTTSNMNDAISNDEIREGFVRNAVNALRPGTVNSQSIKMIENPMYMSQIRYQQDMNKESQKHRHRLTEKEKDHEYAKEMKKLDMLYGNRAKSGDKVATFDYAPNGLTADMLTYDPNRKSWENENVALTNLTGELGKIDAQLLFDFNLSDRRRKELEERRFNVSVEMDNYIQSRGAAINRDGVREKLHGEINIMLEKIFKQEGGNILDESREGLSFSEKIMERLVGSEEVPDTRSRLSRLESNLTANDVKDLILNNPNISKSDLEKKYDINISQKSYTELMKFMGRNGKSSEIIQKGYDDTYGTMEKVPGLTIDLTSPVINGTLVDNITYNNVKIYNDAASQIDNATVKKFMSDFENGLIDMASAASSLYMKEDKAYIKIPIKETMEDKNGNNVNLKKTFGGEYLTVELDRNTSQIFRRQVYDYYKNDLSITDDVAREALMMSVNPTYNALRDGVSAIAPYSEPKGSKTAPDETVKYVSVRGADNKQYAVRFERDENDNIRYSIFDSNRKPLMIPGLNTYTLEGNTNTVIAESMKLVDFFSTHDKK